MRYFLLAILPFLAIFLQSTFFNSYSIKGAVPDIVLVFVIFYALLNGGRKGAYYGLCCGLLEDLFIGRFIGINAIAKAITAYVIGILQGRVFEENVIVGIIGVILGSIINAGLLLVLVLLNFSAFNVNELLFMDMLYQTLYNALVAAPIYIWFYQSSRRGLLKGTGEI
ncbi:Cell shape-determining protein MreD [Syntrophomonas zehnderi OL-4]|uniref:Cell shape-determining protein MreD n=1 Tax=Syntrophomonas zehnderi OL-4 TaxID=690567 RepID=A0A0E4C932_9FIRM|nr:rod shape-determining protein MreD [Syntrophomonas zehnderi]CFX80796.1 Cell shape-determining protein MreD [Syntrophomonas zehnderi OL-4]